MEAELLVAAGIGELDEVERHHSGAEVAGAVRRAETPIASSAARPCFISSEIVTLALDPSTGVNTTPSLRVLGFFPAAVAIIGFPSFRGFLVTNNRFGIS